MAVILQDVLDHIVSHAMTLGVFSKVNQHEPKNAPSNTGISCAVWVAKVTPIKTSGLASTSTRIVFNVRLFSNMLAEAQDDIDPDLTNALNALFAAYSGDFTFDGTVRSIDLLGSHGVSMEAEAGYLNQDGKLFRVFTITLPVIINDAWTQTP